MPCFRAEILTAAPSSEFIKRQANTAGNVPVNVAAMTDKDGNVILFDANNVYKDATEKGL